MSCVTHCASLCRCRWTQHIVEIISNVVCDHFLPQRNQTIVRKIFSGGCEYPNRISKRIYSVRLFHGLSLWLTKLVQQCSRQNRFRTALRFEWCVLKSTTAFDRSPEKKTHWQRNGPLMGKRRWWQRWRWQGKTKTRDKQQAQNGCNSREEKIEIY